MAIEKDLFTYSGIDTNTIKIKKTSLGIVYKGSKRNLAYDILKTINKEAPEATTIYDLFGGGGAITASALASGYNVVYNDISKMYMFFEYLKNPKPSKFGIFPEHFYHFLERDAFVEIRNKKYEERNFYDFAMFLLYSFCTRVDKGVSYFCNRGKIPFKRAGHNLVVFQCKESAEFLDNHFKGNYFKDFIKIPFQDWREARKLFANVMLKIESLYVTGLLHTSPFKTLDDIISAKTKDVEKYVFANMPKDTPFKVYKGGGLKQLQQLQRLEQLEQLQQLQQLQRLEQLQRLQQLQQLERLEQLQQLQRLERLEVFNKDYREVEIKHKPSECVIYCDIPYKDVTGYFNAFSHEEFYEWALSMHAKGYKVFISEYEMPNDFKEIYRKEVLVRTTQKNLKYQMDKLFIPKGGNNGEI